LTFNHEKFERVLKISSELITHYSGGVLTPLHPKLVHQPPIGARHLEKKLLGLFFPFANVSVKAD
jgi:hypothetical protein